jgi:hypothetical protein
VLSGRRIQPAAPATPSHGFSSAMDNHANHMYRRGMHRSSLFLWVVLCLHCGGQTQTGPTDEAPTTPAPTEAPAADTNAPATEPAPAEMDTPTTSAETSSKPNCAKLPKIDCKVMRGCAWSDKLKCVEEGPSE